MKGIVSRAGIAGWMLVTCVAAVWQQEESPRDVLKAAGLQRFGNSYILEGEREAGKLIETVEELQQRVQRMTLKKEGLERTVSEDARKAQSWRNEADELRRRARRIRSQDRAKADQLEKDARELDQKANRLRKTDVTDKRQKQQLSETETQLDAARKELRQAQNRLRDLTSRTQQKYQQLEGDSKVMAALQAFNRETHPKVALGPASAYVANVARLCIDRLRDMGLHNEGGLFHLAEEDEIARVASDANLRLHRLNESGGLPSARAELAQTARSLRDRVNRLETRREELGRSNEVADLLSEIQKATKQKVRLGTSESYQRALKELQALEKATMQP